MNTLHSVVYTVHDLAAAKTLHAAVIGAEPHTDQPYYVGFNVGGVEIGFTPAAEGQATGPVPNFLVPDLDAAVAEAEAAGGKVVDAPRKVAPNTRVATVADAGGSRTGLIESA